MKNKYAKRARISEAKIREIVRYVAADLTALQAAALSGLNRNTVNRLYRGVRERMLLACEAQRRLFGVVEVDESFFGARRVKGRRGRGAYGKTVVFGIFERQGYVYTEIVPDCSKPTLQGIIRGRVDPRTVINSDGWRGYHGLVDLGYGHVVRRTLTTSYVPSEPISRMHMRRFTRLTMPATSSPNRASTMPAHQRHRPYQRHRRLLGPGQGPADQVQGPAETHLPPPSQGDRMAIQPSPRRQVQMPTTVPT